MMKKIVLTICLILLSGFSFAGVAEDNAATDFIKGNLSYNEGHYGEAAVIYEGIIQDGLESGPVYYNLGNSYFKRGEMGKAILNYERAKRFIPRDPDLKANYKYAFSLAGNSVLEDSRPFWRKLIEKYTGAFTLDEFVIILFGLALFSGSLHLISLYFCWPSRRRVVLLIAIGIIFWIYALGLVTKINHEKNISIVVKRTEALFEPRADATAYFDLNEGKRVKVLKETGAWVKIERLDGKSGWVLKENIKEIY